MTAVYAIVQVTNHGWGSWQVLGFGAVAAVLMAAFLALETRIENPIMPLRVLRLHGLVASSVVRGLLVTGMYSTFFLGTLYLEHVRHFSALQTGLAFLPWTITVGILSTGVTARLVERFGQMRVLIPGLVSVIVGLLLMRSAGASTSFFPTVFFANFFIGLGIGNAFMPLLQIAMADVPAQDAGLGSGIINVSQQVAGALGLAVLGTVATSHSKTLLAQHHTVVDSLLGGYHLAFGIGVVAVIAAIATAVVVLRTPVSEEAEERAEAVALVTEEPVNAIRKAGRMMPTTSTFPPRRPGAPIPTRPSTPSLPPRRPSPQGEVTRLAEAVRMEAAAMEAGRQLRRSGRVRLPVRTGRPR